MTDVNAGPSIRASMKFARADDMGISGVRIRPESTLPSSMREDRDPRGEVEVGFSLFTDLLLPKMDLAIRSWLLRHRELEIHLLHSCS